MNIEPPNRLITTAYTVFQICSVCRQLVQRFETGDVAGSFTYLAPFIHGVYADYARNYEAVMKQIKVSFAVLTACLKKRIRFGFSYSPAQQHCHAGTNICTCTSSVNAVRSIGRQSFPSSLAVSVGGDVVSDRGYPRQRVNVQLLLGAAEYTLTGAFFKKCCGTASHQSLVLGSWTHSLEDYTPLVCAISAHTDHERTNSAQSQTINGQNGAFTKP